MFTKGEKQKAAAVKVFCRRLGITAIDSMKMIVVLIIWKKISLKNQLFTVFHRRRKNFSVIKLSFASESSSLGHQATWSINTGPWPINNAQSIVYNFICSPPSSCVAYPSKENILLVITWTSPLDIPKFLSCFSEMGYLVEPPWQCSSKQSRPRAPKDTSLCENWWGHKAWRYKRVAAQSFAAPWASQKGKELWKVSLPPTRRAMWAATGWGTSVWLKLGLSPRLPHNLSSFSSPSLSLLTALFVCSPCSWCQALFHATLSHTTLIKLLPDLSKLSQMVRNLARPRKSSSYNKYITLFARQLLAVLSCCVKLLLLPKLLCSLCCCNTSPVHICDASPWFAMWFWLGSSTQAEGMLGYRPMNSEMTAELMCLTFGAYGAWFSEVLETADRNSQCLPLLGYASFLIACFSTYLTLFSLYCLDHGKGINFGGRFLHGSGLIW